MQRNVPISLILLLLALTLTLSGCVSTNAQDAETTTPLTQPEESEAAWSYETPAFDAPDAARKHAALPATVTEGDADLILNGVRMQFVTAAEKAALHAPLVRLLSNVSLPVYEDHEWVDNEASVNPDAPTIENGYYCALFDVTMDGTPELLVYPVGGGGSSGNSSYYVYDIPTGKEIGWISCAHGENFTHYYRPDNGRVYSLAIYTLRSGDKADYLCMDYISVASGILQGSGEEVFNYRSSSHLSSYYEHEIVSCDGEGNVVGGFGDHNENTHYELLPSGETYKVQGHAVDAESYYTEWEWMTRNLIRIPETEFRAVEWEELPENPTAQDYVRRAEIMAEDLLSLPQKFLRFAEE